MAVALNINGRKVALDVPDDTPLLWAVRDELDLMRSNSSRTAHNKGVSSGTSKATLRPLMFNATAMF